MAAVTADASALIALGQIDQLSLLEKLFGEVMIPSTVARDVAPGLAREANVRICLGRTLMSTGVDAIYEDGVFKPEQPVSLKEKTRVHLVIEDASPTADDDDPTGWKTAESFVGFIKDAPEGEPIAREHDKQLYK